MIPPLFSLDVIRIFRAILTNTFAAASPHLYIRLTKQTGRGSEEEEPRSIADYFLKCVNDYREIINDDCGQQKDIFNDKIILEYGPGDNLAAALLFHALGARKVICVDRFPMLSLKPDNLRVLSTIVDLLDGENKERAQYYLKSWHRYPLNDSSSPIVYTVSQNGLSGLGSEIDIAVSRAVMEHVNDLHATLSDMYEALRPGGVGVHLVDLRSHGLHQQNELDFLKWPNWLWILMYSHKGVPNRLRLDTYRKLLNQLAFSSVVIKPTSFASAGVLEEARPCLAAQFRQLPDEILGCLGFWLKVTK